jgi:uncharacterized protein (DUF1778 family)
MTHIIRAAVVLNGLKVCTEYILSAAVSAARDTTPVIEAGKTVL